jgi:HAD superfamily hydrolase (TIGR01509 family)
LFAKDKTYHGSLNTLHKELLAKNPQYDVNEVFELDKDLLTFIKGLKEMYILGLFTSELIQEVPAIRNELAGVFEHVFSAKKIGLQKDTPQAYIYLVKALGVQPQEIAFIDDSEQNIQAAQEAGLMAILFQDPIKLKPQLLSL